MTTPAIQNPTPTWNGGSSPTGTFTFAATAGGTVLSVKGFWGGSAPTLFQDTAANTWVKRVEGTNALFGSGETVYDCLSCNASAIAFTATLTCVGNQDIVISGQEYPAGTAILDSGFGQNGGTTGGASLVLNTVAGNKTGVMGGSSAWGHWAGESITTAAGSVFVMMAYAFGATSTVGTIGGVAANDLNGVLSDLHTQDLLVASGGGGSAILLARKRYVAADDLTDERSARRAFVGVPSVSAATFALYRPRRLEEIPLDDSAGRSVRRAALVASPAAALAMLSLPRRAQDTPDDSTAAHVRGLVMAQSQAPPIAQIRRPPDDAVPDEIARRSSRAAPSVAPWLALAAQRRSAELDADQERQTRVVLSPAVAAQSFALALPKRIADDADDGNARRPAFAAPQVTAWRALTQPRRGAEYPAEDPAQGRRSLSTAQAVATQGSQLYQPTRRNQDADDTDRSRRGALAPAAPTQSVAVLARPLRAPDDAPDEQAIRRAGVTTSAQAAPILTAKRNAVDLAGDEQPRARAALIQAQARAFSFSSLKRTSDDAPDDTRARSPALLPAQARSLLSAQRRSIDELADEPAQRRSAIARPTVTPWRVLAIQRQPIDDAIPDDYRPRALALSLRALRAMVSRYRASFGARDRKAEFAPIDRTTEAAPLDRKAKK